MHKFALASCQSASITIIHHLPGNQVSTKSDRLQVIRDLVARHDVGSQEELRLLLAQRGWTVTQSTLSRDMRELRLARLPGADGNTRYAFAEPGAGPDAGSDAATRLEAMLPQLLTGVEGVQVLVVARTMKSAAQPVAEALDQLKWPDVAGTIAGDDTVLIICRSSEGRERVLRRMRNYLEHRNS